MRKRDLAQQVWERLFGFFVHTRPQRDLVLSELGLTPNDSKALYSLDPVTGRSMRELATAWKCDASTATWAVDRLERLRLAERRPHPRDRRVRLVVLTEKGRSVKTDLLESMYQAPPELLELTVKQLKDLRNLLGTLPTGLDEFPRAI